MMIAKAASAEDIPDAITQITGLLRERHHLPADRGDDFDIRDMTEMSKTMSRTSELVGMLLMFVAAISLVVGGVGIMNIMLVSVTERTREIGLRMAVGARSYHILRQFLVEAVSALPARRRDRHPVWPRSVDTRALDRALADRPVDPHDRRRGARLRRSRRHLRLLSGLEGLAARSDRGVAIRIGLEYTVADTNPKR